MEDLEEMVQIALDYIEKESEFWDEESLRDGGLPYLMLFIQQAVCKIMFIQIHKALEKVLEGSKTGGIYCFDEEDLKEESFYYYCDCIQEICKKSSLKNNDKRNDIDFWEFYDYFLKFIQFFHNKRVGEDMGEELNQLCQLMQIAFFRDKYGEEIVENDIVGPQLRNVANGDKNVDVRNQTKRFWVRWIVGKTEDECTNATLAEKNIKENELVFWLIMAAIYNFTTPFGGDKMKELKRCISNKRDIEESDISKAWNWCFSCWTEMIMHKMIDELDFIDDKHPEEGLVLLANRFNYRAFKVKNRLKDELERLLKIPNKEFNVNYATYVLDSVKEKSWNNAERNMQDEKFWDEIGRIVQDEKFWENGERIVQDEKFWDNAEKIMQDEKYLGEDESIIQENKKVTYKAKLKEIFGDFNIKYFSENRKKCTDERSKIEKKKYNKNVMINRFIAYEFLKLYLSQDNPLVYLFLAEKHLFFYQLDILMFDGELSERKKSLYGTDCKSKNEYMRDRLFEIEKFLFSFCNRVIKEEENSINVYLQILLKIIEGKKIKVSEKLISRLLELRTDFEEFCVDLDGYVSWEGQTNSMIEEALSGSIYYATIKSFCDKLEYEI